MVDKESFKPNLNGSMEQRRMEAQKRKDLPDGLVFAKVKGVTEMHPLDKVELHITVNGTVFDGTLGEFIKLTAKNEETHIKNEQIFKNTITKLIDRVEKLEKVVEKYGMA